MTAWPADRVERWPIERLIPYARNARTHTDEQVALIAASIREWGWTTPVLVDETGNLIAGHGRVLAARQLGLAEIPTMTARGWSDAQIRAYRIADNQLAQRAGWDDELLHLELSDLRRTDYNLDLIGFADRELAELLADRTEGLTDPDEAPPLPEEPVSRAGDLWTLGRHRLLCGDATSADDVARVVNGTRVELCLTDPPYGVGETYVNYRDDIAELDHLIQGFVPTARALASCVLLTPGSGRQYRYPPPDWTLAWFVPAGVGRTAWGFCCWQPVLAYGNDPFLAQGKGGRPDALCLTEAAENSLGHPCPKPVKVWSWFMERGSVSPGDRVLDPFVGSGTTIIAAEMTGRTCHALEIAPAYVDVAVKRWQNFTGQQATRESDGAAFDEVAAKTAAEAAEPASPRAEHR